MEPVPPSFTRGQVSPNSEVVASMNATGLSCWAEKRWAECSQSCSHGKTRSLLHVRRSTSRNAAWTLVNGKHFCPAERCVFGPGLRDASQMAAEAPPRVAAARRLLQRVCQATAREAAKQPCLDLQSTQHVPLIFEIQHIGHMGYIICICLAP